MRAPPPTRTVARPDGRRLAFCEYGPPDGTPVFYFHGFPGSRLEVALAADEVARTGARLIAIDRPGFGRSDEEPRRTLLDWPADVECVAGALGLERFACLGASGGGPYALACAYALARRLDGVAIACGLGPYDDPAARRGMLLANRILFAVALAPRPLARWIVARPLRALRRDPERAIRRLLSSLPAVDRAALADPERQRLFAASTVEALRQGTRPFLQEVVLYARPWGFRLEDVAAEVRLYQGELDRNVPPGMGRAQEARLPRCRARYFPEEGHYSLVLGHVEEIVGALVAPAPSS